MRGRRPKPTALKLVTGNPGKRKLNSKEPSSGNVVIMPPGMPERAKTAWRKLVPLLSRMGVLNTADAYALERLVLCYADIVECQKVIKNQGRTYETENREGVVMVRPRPEVGMLADADRRLKGYLVEFGLTPAARSRIEANAEQKEDAAEAYFN